MAQPQPPPSMSEKPWPESAVSPVSSMQSTEAGAGPQPPPIAWEQSGGALDESDESDGMGLPPLPLTTR